MTLKEFAAKHFTTIKHLSQVWEIPFLNLRRYSVAQQHNTYSAGMPSARIPRIKTRLLIEELTHGQVHHLNDWGKGVTDDQ